MSDLAKQELEAVSADTPSVVPEEVKKLKTQIPDWHIVEKEGQLQLKKLYEFPDFREAITFTKAVGDLAESEGHHPTLLTEWGKVTVSWWTHAIAGLHKNDYIMAAKTDKIREIL
ncbi:MAG: 4a-hydroxytetrahydrobiopterin dehydratase [cyanobacterium endosymbiont of Rhopalodia musculus]|uniref:4a-hydroxytetrahydrobiopterin dehydratase n=1 Tax=cyanobacterium endosymbiont of Epithemia clementina EcSB TaxID=3034674 RepID=UPI00247FA895|nr:4a-hydroxytetrahydrobiopterin dehydratase [cyanobacterium endosymbiont of Epithemia clementina EcSB]WGT66649.1 4a-hydroxytetrahydrobiopterin dehydratase [cyanobacterium endosymbiont of Epithemia clementina EcSB]